VPRPSRPLLTREGIVAAATGIIDEDGLAALSTRALAARLGVSGPSLYHHFETKDEILDAVADEIVASVDTSMFAADPWPEALRAWARSYRAALAAHPNVVPHLAQGPGRRPAALAMADTVYGALVAAGWPPARATHIGALLRYLVAGSALGSFARGFVDDPEFYASRYPHLGQAHRLAAHSDRVDEGAFELGLDAIIDGLVRLRESMPPEERPPAGEW
jgi:AcrR family transcriptional regulator